MDTITITAPALFSVEVAAAGRHHILLVGPTGPDRLTAAMRIAAALPAGVPFVTLDAHLGTIQKVEDAVKAAEGGVLFVDRLDETSWETPARLMPAVEEGRLLLIGAVSELPLRMISHQIFTHIAVRLSVAEVLAAHASEGPVTPVNAADVELSDGGLEVMKAAEVLGRVYGDVEWLATARVAKTVAAMLGYQQATATHVHFALSWRTP